MITGVGTGLTGAFTLYWSLIGATVCWSIGVYHWATVVSSITLSLARGQGGRAAIGWTAEISAAVSIGARLSKNVDASGGQTR